jgi:hypothetical protein
LIKKRNNITLRFSFLLLFSLLLLGAGLSSFSIADSTKLQVIHLETPADSLQNIIAPCSYNPSLWLKADAGITQTGTTVRRWEDQSGNNNHAIQNGANVRPTYQSESINFNPALDFDGVDDYIAGTSGGSISTLFMVARSDSDVSRSSNGQTIITTSITNTISNSYFFTIGRVTAAFSNEVITHGLGHSGEYRKALTGNTVIENTPHLYTTDHNTATSNASIFMDGTKIDNTTSGNFVTPHNNRPYRIGGNLYVWGGVNFDGQIAEIISFPTNLNTTNREIIQSYLGIKYGIKLSHALRNSAGTVTWNESTYINNVSSIGRDDCFGLNQKQSKSTEDGAILTIGLGMIASSNSANTNTFPNNQSFLFWGHDNDDDGTIEEISSELPTGINTRLDREWKVKNINGVDTVELQFDLSGITHSATNANELYLLIDEDGDGDFTTGMVQKIVANSYTGNVASFTNIVFPDSVIISVGTGPVPNNAPVLTCTSDTTEACPNSQFYAFASSITVADADNDTLTATLTFMGITQSTDTMAVNLTGFPMASQTFNYPDLEITGTITPTQLQSILQTLSFSTSSLMSGIREVEIVVDDGTDKSNTLIKRIQSDENLSICCSADAPLISN